MRSVSLVFGQTDEFSTLSCERHVSQKEMAGSEKETFSFEKHSVNLIGHLNIIMPVTVTIPATIPTPIAIPTVVVVVVPSKTTG